MLPHHPTSVSLNSQQHTAELTVDVYLYIYVHVCMHACVCVLFPLLAWQTLCYRSSIIETIVRRCCCLLCESSRTFRRKRANNGVVGTRAPCALPSPGSLDNRPSLSHAHSTSTAGSRSTTVLVHVVQTSMHYTTMTGAMLFGILVQKFQQISWIY